MAKGTLSKEELREAFDEFDCYEKFIYFYYGHRRLSIIDIL